MGIEQFLKLEQMSTLMTLALLCPISHLKCSRAKQEDRALFHGALLSQQVTAVFLVLPSLLLLLMK